jgi:hypothetical protein
VCARRRDQRLVAVDTGHNIQVDQPGAVVEQIEHLLG